MPSDAIRLAQSCSTCKFARFNPAKGYTPKRMGGLCVLNCQHPKGNEVFMPISPVNLRNIINLDDILHKGQDAYGNCVFPTVQEFIDLVMAKSNMRVHSRGGDVTEELLHQYYHDLLLNYDWWRANEKKVRYVHRQTACDCWEEAPKTELAARAAVNANKKP